MSFRTKIGLVVLVALGCLYLLLGRPNLPPTNAAELRENLEYAINLGLDLKGGSHMVLQVQVQDALKATADRTIEGLRRDLRTEGFSVGLMRHNDPQTAEDADGITITIEDVPADAATALRRVVNDNYVDWIPESTSASRWEMKMRPSALVAFKERLIDQTIGTIGNRINGLGLTEPVIQKHGRADAEYEILVQLPGEDDPGRTRDLIQQTALLEIQNVRDPTPYPSREAALSANGGALPPNSEILQFADPARGGWFVLERTPIITGQDLRDATPSRNNEDGMWQTGFTLTQEAGRRFGDYTGANVGNSLAVVLDSRIKNVATIQSRINSDGVITGQTTLQEAQDLELVLDSGSLAASLDIIEERTVGASLGADSIRQGVRSALLGLALVALAMLVYYKKAGINANVALILNLLILLAVLSMFDFTLTLPGIAGIILTIGMAVDANVLIFERIREELRSGKSVVAALDAGFGKAFLTIIDANLTTIIAALFLFIFGRGPVRGFAVTLAVGLIANVFTSVFVSRLIFDLSLSRKKRVTELSI